MTESGEKFFLFVGLKIDEAVTSKLKTEGSRYEQKLLRSSPENWRKIIEYVKSDALLGVIATFTASDYHRFLLPSHKAVAVDLLDAIATTPHIVFIHESVFFAPTEEPAHDDSEPAQSGDAGYGFVPVGDWDADVIADPRDLDSDIRYAMRWRGSITDQMREEVNEMLHSRDINVAAYGTNAERSVLSAAFFEDQDRNLLFRIYVPSGRLYANEADTLLGLFRDWLNQTGRDSIRQDGYRTSAGQVYEFFSAESNPTGDLTRQFQDFSDFLEACVDNPETAIAELTGNGVQVANAERMVSRYGKLTRRLHLDLRHTREERLMSLRHELESELLDSDEAKSLDLIGLLQGLVVPVTNAASAILSSAGQTESIQPALNVTVNQQIVGQVTGHIIQNVQGTVHLGPEAKDILGLVEQFAGSRRPELESALHELEDSDARISDRLLARQKLRRFLSSLGSQASGMALATLQKYVEHRIGIG